MTRFRAGMLAALVVGLAAAGAAAQDTDALRAHLDMRREAAAGQADATGHRLEARVTAESRSGVRRLRIRDFQLLSDSDRDYAGYNLGAGSWDTQIAVLASAVADEFAIQAAAANVPLDAVDVVFTSQPDDPAVARARAVRYPRNLSYVAYLDSPASDAQLEELRRAVERTSPVLSLVSASQEIGHGEIVLDASPTQRDPALPPGLRDFLVEKRAAILRRQSATRAAPAPLVAHARIEPRTGLREVRTGAGGFRFLHDSWPERGGYGLAPTVEEHQLGVLGTCLTHIFEIQAATRQIVLDSLELRFSAELTPRRGAGEDDPPRLRDIRYSIHVESPAGAAEIGALRDAVEASCPLYNLLKDEQEIRGRIVRGRYAARPS